MTGLSHLMCRSQFRGTMRDQAEPSITCFMFFASGLSVRYSRMRSFSCISIFSNRELKGGRGETGACCRSDKLLKYWSKIGSPYARGAGAPRRGGTASKVAEGSVLVLKKRG